MLDLVVDDDDDDDEEDGKSEERRWDQSEFSLESRWRRLQEMEIEQRSLYLKPLVLIPISRIRLHSSSGRNEFEVDIFVNSQDR